ncbi:MAG: glycosyltransferase family 9 protein [Acidobacteriota bacterium]
MGSSQAGHWLLSWAYDPKFCGHQLHDADALLTRLGLDGADERWRAPMPEFLVELGQRVLQGTGIDPKAIPVGLAPGVAWGGSAKRWPEEYFGRLAALLKAGGFEPVVVIGPGEAEIARSMKRASGMDLPVVAEDLDAAGLGAVLTSLSALVGNDSGPAHLASVLGVRTVALFGPTDDRRTAPMTPPGMVLRRPLECAPCGQLKCPLVHQGCLKELDPSDVYDAVAEQFEQRLGARRLRKEALRNSRPDAFPLAGASL